MKHSETYKTKTENDWKLKGIVCVCMRVLPCLEKSLPLLNRECVGLVRKGTPPCNTDTGCAPDMLLWAMLPVAQFWKLQQMYPAHTAHDIKQW